MQPQNKDLLTLAQDDLDAATKSYIAGQTTDAHLRLVFAQTEALMAIARKITGVRPDRDRPHRSLSPRPSSHRR